MWAFNALLMLLGATGPSAYLWLSRSPGLGSGLATYAATDGTFLLVALVFLRLGVRWGRQQYPHVMAPYLGAWIEKDGRQRAPTGFAPFYLLVAFVLSFVIPAGVLLYFLLQPAAHPCRLLVLESLVPYLLVFVPQMLLETKYMRTTVMAPTIPIVFMLYRLWQFLRSLALVDATQPQEQVAWFKLYLLGTLGFWIFDTAALLTWLPWTYNWQLQPDMSKVRSSRRSGSSSSGGSGEAAAGASSGRKSD